MVEGFDGEGECEEFHGIRRGNRTACERDLERWFGELSLYTEGTLHQLWPQNRYGGPLHEVEPLSAKLCRDLYVVGSRPGRVRQAVERLPGAQGVVARESSCGA